MIEEFILRELYLRDKKSIQDIAEIFGCSAHKIGYWIKKYNIPMRTHSEATYVKRNPDGDPFMFRNPMTFEEFQLFGLGIGLYWGEGTKANLNSVRLGNTNPLIIEKFINFLVQFF